MKQLIVILFFSFWTSAFAQDSVTTWKRDINIRKDKPFFIFLDVNGVGLGYSVVQFVDIQVSTLLLTSNASAKIYLLKNNSSPFIGFSVGRKYLSFGGSGESNNWKLVFAGWQYHPFDDKGLFLAVMYQYILSEENKNAEWPTMFSFNLGVRVF